MTGSNLADVVRQSMLQLSWTLEHQSLRGESWPLELCSAWEQQVTAALSESQLRSMECGDESISVNRRASSTGLWVQLQLWSN